MSSQIKYTNQISHKIARYSLNQLGEQLEEKLLCNIWYDQLTDKLGGFLSGYLKKIIKNEIHKSTKFSTR